MSGAMNPILLRAIEAVGGTAELAKRLGIQAPSIYSWRRVPATRVLAVEAATGISRHELRPDIYPRDSTPPLAANDATKPPAKRSRAPVKPSPKRGTRATTDTSTLANVA
jgi:DNA-binding transcriptional regulator YdaS (Cro superfamily)